MGRRKPVTPLDRFEWGLPAAWTKTNLLKRARNLAIYTRKIIKARGIELGMARSRDLAYKEVIENLEGDLTQSEIEVHTLEEQVGRLQEVASAAAWVVADHMSGSYGAVVTPGNTPVTPEQHGDGICRVLALNLMKLELPDDMEGVEDFVTDDFNRTYQSLARSAPKEVAR